MAGYDRAELDEMVQRWLDGTQKAEATGEWKPLADMYTEDASYGWNYGPQQDFMAVGREEIRELAFGQEMEGLDGWEYPYKDFVVDERRGTVIGLWRQVSGASRADGSEYAIYGIAGSWFRYGGNFQWSWQRDFFDIGNASALFLEMYQDGALSAGMQSRMKRAIAGEGRQGWYPAGKAPVPLW